MKCAFIEATLPELKGGKMYQSGRGEGSNSKAAISRAFGDMFKKIGRKHVSVIQARISLTIKNEASVEEETLNGVE